MPALTPSQEKIARRIQGGATLALSPRSGRYEFTENGEAEQIDQRPILAMLRDGTLIQETMTGRCVLPEPVVQPTFAERAAKVRASLPVARVALAFAGWPRGEEIPARENFNASYYLGKLPKSGPKRLATIQEKIAATLEGVARSVELYNRVLTEGPLALSDYDLMIAFSENAIKACVGTLRIKEAHISADLAIVAALRAELAALDAPQAPAAEAPPPDVFRPGQRCEIIAVQSAHKEADIGKRIVIVKVNPDFRSVWAHDDKPVKYRTNRNGRRVTDYDPRCIQSVYGFEQLRIIGPDEAAPTGAEVRA
jgi:hypothetical protein